MSVQAGKFAYNGPKPDRAAATNPKDQRCFRWTIAQRSPADYSTRQRKRNPTPFSYDILGSKKAKNVLAFPIWAKKRLWYIKGLKIQTKWVPKNDYFTKYGFFKVIP